jgi:hypothetical protein
MGQLSRRTAILVVFVGCGMAFAWRGREAAADWASGISSVATLSSEIDQPHRLREHVEAPKPLFIPDPGGTPRDGCFPASLIRGAKVAAAGAYEGGRSTDLVFEAESDEVGSVGLLADKSGPPLLLVVAGNDPIIWDFADFPKSRLRGVLVFGYSAQGVAHLPGTVPVRFANRDSGNSSCGSGSAAWETGRGLNNLQGNVRRALGVGLSSFQGAYSPNALHVEGGSLAGATIPEIKSTDVEASAPLQKTGLLAGDHGLAQLVDGGALRHATAADLQRWPVAKRANYDLKETYVVLRSTTLPRDMYGMNSRLFLIPRKVARPRDPGSHNQFIHEGGGCTRGVC